MSESFVTDTHPLLYYFTGESRKLSRKVKRTFDDAFQNKRTLIYVPAVVLWETSILIERAKIALDTTLTNWINSLFTNPTVLSQPFDETTMTIYHRLTFSTDPFDKAIVATALQLDIPLITNDSTMHDAKPCVLYWD